MAASEPLSARGVALRPVSIAPLMGHMEEDLQRIEIDSEDALWEWLSAHHHSENSYLRLTWKKVDPTRYVSREQILDALLAFGWVDGRRYAVDETKTMQLICKRQRQNWTKSYRDRIAKLSSLGLLQPPGLAAVNAAKAKGTWLANQDVDNLEGPADLRDALSAQNGLDWRDAAAPSYRRNVLR